MPNFSMVLTAAGAELLAKGVAGKTMQFTAIAVGDGTFSGSPVDATALQREVKRLPIQRMTRRKNTVSLRATLEAGTVKSGFIWTELGVFATDPDTQGDVLYMYGYAGAESDAVPAANEPTIIEKIINVNVIVASAENVTAIIDTSLVYLTQADLDAHNADPEANPAAIQTHNDNPKAHEELFSQKADLGEDGKIPDAQLPDMDYVARTGDTMTGNLIMSDGATITGLPTPSGNADAVPKSFLTAQLSNYLARSGGTMSGTINMNSKKITNLPTPSAAKDAVPKDYVDSSVKNGVDGLSKIDLFTYLGNGSNSVTIRFPWKPKLVIINAYRFCLGPVLYGHKEIYVVIASSSVMYVGLEWGESSVTLTSSDSSFSAYINASGEQISALILG